MKVEIYMSYEKIQIEESGYKEKLVPRSSAKIDIPKEEMEYIKTKHKEVFEAITRLLNFTIQFMQ